MLVMWRKSIDTIKNWFGGEQRDRELDAELRTYAELRADERVAAGTAPGVARRETLMEMGGMEQLKEEVREVRSGRWLEQFAQDLRFVLRMLRRAPGFTAVAVLTLALGIGANTAIFSVVYGVLLQPLAYPEADRIGNVWVYFSPQNNPHGHLCVADFLDWRAQNHAFEDPSVYQNNLFDITGIGTPEQVFGASVTSGFFPTMRVPPLIGRTFAPGEDSPATGTLTVLSETLWRRRFGGSSDALGKVITVNGQKATIIGVMPASFRFPREDTFLWTNLRIAPPTRRGPFNLIGVARLKPGVTWKQAQAETNAIGHSIELGGHGLYRNMSMPILPIREALVGNTRLPLLIMFGAVIAVLLIASANVANLLLARSTARNREMAVRVSIGAKPGRLVRQLLTESVTLAFAGGAAGVLLAWYGIKALQGWNPGNLPRIAEIHLSAPVLAFSAAVALLTGVIFGVIPALHAARTEPVSALKNDTRAGTSSGQRTRSILAVAEISISFVLLVVGGLLLRSFERLESVDTGITAPPSQVITMLVSPSPARYGKPEAQVALFERLTDRLKEVPGIESLAWSDARPPNYWTNDDTFRINGQAWSQEAFPSSPIPTVSPDYFRVLGIPLLRGRYLDAGDAAQRPKVAVISETLARRYFQKQDPIGQEIGPSQPEAKQPWYRIVGVVGDVKYGGMGNDITPVWYTALAQGPDVPMFLMVRTSRGGVSLGAPVEQAIHSVDPDIVVTEHKTLEEVITGSVAQPRFRTALLAVFAAIALVLAAIGTYGVIAYSVTQRTREIGVRVALGAQPAQVLRMVIREGAMLGIAGIVIGFAVALGATRAVASLLFSTSATDAVTFVAVTVILVAISVWASIVPARRAMNINPVEALRWE
jgi:predicted permease